MPRAIEDWGCWVSRGGDLSCHLRPQRDKQKKKKNARLFVAKDGGATRWIRMLHGVYAGLHDMADVGIAKANVGLGKDLRWWDGQEDCCHFKAWIGFAQGSWTMRYDACYGKSTVGVR